MEMMEFPKFQKFSKTSKSRAFLGPKRIVFYFSLYLDKLKLSFVFLHVFQFFKMPIICTKLLNSQSEEKMIDILEIPKITITALKTNSSVSPGGKR